MVKLIRYKCGFEDCNEKYQCEVGFWARVNCKHPTTDGKVVEWYPVRILEVVI